MGGKPTSLQAEKLNGSSSSLPPPSSSTAIRNGSAATHRSASSSPASGRLTSKQQQQCPVILSESDKQLIKRTWRRLQKPPSSSMSISASSKTGSDTNGTNGSNVDENADAMSLSAIAASRHLDELGVLIFLRIFEIAPETRDAFPQFRRFTDRSALISNVVFRCHARRFVRAVQSVVENIDSLDVVARPNLELLGRRHRDFSGFQPRYLQAFEMAMDDIWRRQLGRRRYGPSTRRAWRKVFELITSAVLDGYVDDVSGQGCCPSVNATLPASKPLTEAVANNGNGYALQPNASFPVDCPSCPVSMTPCVTSESVLG